MSHAIERNKDGTYSMAWAGETPWHGLGKKVSPDLSAKQMLKAAKLDWKVEQRPLFYRDNKGEYLATTHTALVRSTDSALLTYVDENWNPLQNSEAFDFFHEFVERGDMEMHTAGSLLGGKIVWGLAKIKNSFSVFGKDQVDNYLLFSNPHKYGKSIDIRTTSVRVVCNNTITMALQGKSNNQIARISHRGQFDPEVVKATLGIVTEKHNQLKKASEFLAKKKAKIDQVKLFMQHIFPGRGDELSRNAKMAMGILDQQPGADLFPGTWYNALQAVTFMTSHEIGHGQDSRLWKQWFGETQTKGVEALNKAVEFAQAA